MPARVGAILSLSLVMLIWGSTFVITKSVVAEVPPLLFALLRFTVASVLLLAAAATGSLAAMPRPLPWGTLGLMGLTGVTLYFAGFNVALVYTSAADGALIQGTIPAVSALVAAVVLRERLGPIRVLGIAASMLGVAFVVAVGGGGASAERGLLGNVLMFGTVLAWAVYSLLGRRLGAAAGLGATAFSTLLGTVFLLPAVPMNWPHGR